ncbi:MAG: GAF domain-containing protein [Anaerolineales bacterium]|nr:GAF domain-containing protein [Anaerolineales bacterium]
MSLQSADKQTQMLSNEALDQLLTDELSYQPVPNMSADERRLPVWRVRFELTTDKGQQFGLEINDEVHLGRGKNETDVVDLTPYGAERLGVSRRHVALRPTASNLFVMDVGSTNGTRRNGRSIGFNTPYALADGDVLTLGNLQLTVKIVKRPYLQTAPLKKRPDFVDALAQIGKAITSQLNLDEVMNQVVTTAMSLTAAGETSIWLVDEATGELFLEARRGTDDSRLHRTRMPINENTPVGRVIKTGKPLRTNTKPGQVAHQVMTGYLVEALAYVPISLGGITFGVLASAHREPGKSFDDQDERLLGAIADYAAIAIQNARMYQATDKALEERVRELAALNELSRTVSASLNIEEVYAVLVEQVKRHMPVADLQIYLKDDHQPILHPLMTDLALPDYPLGHGILSKVVFQGQSIVTNSIAGLPDFDAQLDAIIPEADVPMAAVPLKVKSEVVGVLVVHSEPDKLFSEEDAALLRAFAHPVATAVENARLYANAERQREAILAMGGTLSEPLTILDDQGNIVVSNDAAQRLLHANMSQYFEAISRSVGRTLEMKIGDETYLSTTEHVDGVGTIAVMQDITYVKQLEQDRSDFMHMLSHDLKNPLMAVTGYANLLERTETLGEKGMRFLDEINIAADRMLEMITKLLDTVADEDAIQLVNEVVDLQEVTAQVLRDTEGAALSKSMEVTAVCHGDAYAINGDRLRLYHMLLNLVENAIKYSPEHTQVTVTLTYGIAKGDPMLIQVADQGAGIPEQDLEFVFDKFFRGVQKGMSSKGSGVGLAAVKSIVVAHRGTIRVENAPTGGAVFTVELPGNLRANR